MINYTLVVNLCDSKTKSMSLKIEEKSMKIKKNIKNEKKTNRYFSV